MKQIIKILKYSFIVIFLISAVLFIYLNLAVNFNLKIKEKEFEIPHGQSLMTITRRLEKQGFIKNYLLAYYYGRFGRFLNKKIKSGKYKLNNKMTMTEVMNVFFKGKFVPEKIVLTIPEGYNIYDLSELFYEKKLINNKEDFLKLTFDKHLISIYNIPGDSLEGYLYPTTYYIAPHDSTREILIRMLDTFHKIFPKKKFENLKFNLNRHEILTLASLIEKETSIDMERELVSSVFHNRLKKNMKIECDPTVIYALLRKGQYKGNLSRRRGDLDIKSFYNTYLYKGLPPSPIANPGKESIEAALNPKKSDYLFFVAQNEKAHLFSTNFKDHSKNVKKYRIWKYNQKR